MFSKRVQWDCICVDADRRTHPLRHGQVGEGGVRLGVQLLVLPHARLVLVLLVGLVGEGFYTLEHNDRIGRAFMDFGVHLVG